MKKSSKLRRKEKFSRAIFLFGQCRYSISKVAYELDISYKEAKQLHNFYLDSQQIDEETQREMTEFCEKQLDQLQKKSDREETVERIIRNVTAERQKDLNKERISKAIKLFREFLSAGDYEATEIFFYNDSGELVAYWAKEESKKSSFWEKIDSSFYSQKNASYPFN